MDPVTGDLVSLGSFSTKRDADQALAVHHADQSRGGWVDPRRGKVLLAGYARNWLDSRPRPLAPRTRELYEGLLANHILPTFGSVGLGGITTAALRSWHAGLVAGGTTTAPAKAYRLLRAILTTAVEDEVLARNPCVIRAAGVEHAPERPVASVADVYAIADAIEGRFRVLILTAAFSSLRQGELFGLRRRDVDLLHRHIKVERQAQTLRGAVVTTAPKSRAGVRTVALPARAPTPSSSAAPRAPCWPGATGRSNGMPPWRRPASRGSISTTCAIPATRSRRLRGRAPRS